jgi:4-amino-4-deoxy-L-arabinose transferase-like glycosyltransferase
LAHAHLLWSDEDYHLAAALQMLASKVPYRDFWYDKPPLCAVYYLLVGGYSGIALRILDAAYILIACQFIYRLARACWGEIEGRIAALLTAFFTAFYLPAAVIPFAADALLLAPHVTAIYYAHERRAAWAGFFCGIGLLVNIKAAFVLAVCALWLVVPDSQAKAPAPRWPFLAGLAAPLAAAGVWFWFSGAAAAFYEQVWRWGLLYSQGSPNAHPFQLGFTRVAAWLGFHAALGVGTLLAFPSLRKEQRWKMGIWLTFSFAAVCLGSRFAPRYFLQLLPPLTVVASRGITLALRRNCRVAWIVLSLLLLLPVVRFGPRYATLAAADLAGRAPDWSDVAMDLDGRQAAAIITGLAKPGDSLFVWGYRPDIYVYTRLLPNGLFWDSQPLTGVPADRHLSVTTAIYSDAAARNRALFVQSRPEFVVDGLGPLNPALALDVYPELGQWLTQYKVISRTKLCVIYRRNQ